MKMKTHLCQAFVTALVLIMVSGCAQLKQIVKQPQVAFESLRIGEVNGHSVTLVPSVTVTNPNNFPVPIKKLDYNLVLNDRQVFSGATEIAGSLAPETPETIEIPVTLSKDTLDFFVNSLFQDKEINYAVAGGASLSGLSVPFSKAGTIYLPEVKTGKFRVNSANLTNLDMALELAVTNKNDFDLPFAGLFYNISSDGKNLFSNEIKQSGIKQKATTNLSLPIRINPSNIFISSLELLSKPEIDIDVNAAADLGFISLPFNTSTRVNLKDYLR